MPGKPGCALMRAPITCSNEMGLDPQVQVCSQGNTARKTPRLLNLCRPVGLAIDRMRLIATCSDIGDAGSADAGSASLGPGGRR